MKRVEVVTSIQRRRRFTDEEKERIVIESMEPGASVAATAERNEISPSLIYTWRKAYAGTRGPVVDESSTGLTAVPQVFARAVASTVPAVCKPIRLHIDEHMVIEFPADADVTRISTLIKAIRE
jgi:transposase